MKRAVTLMLVIIALVLVWRWSLHSSSHASEAPEAIEPKAPSRSKQNARAKRREAPLRLVFRRSSDATPNPKNSSEPTPSVSVPMPLAIDLNDLSKDELSERQQEGSEAIADIAEQCEEHAPDAARVMALTTFDDRGLLEIQLMAYDDDGAEISWSTDEQLPQDLTDCLESAIWDREWRPVEAHHEMRMQLTMRFERDPAPNAP